MSKKTIELLNKYLNTKPIKIYKNNEIYSVDKSEYRKLCNLELVGLVYFRFNVRDKTLYVTTTEKGKSFIL